jgi:predicted nucleic acid-binding protein
VSEPVLLDTGPLVAPLSADDDHHETCASELRRMKRPPLTCWPVLTEAAWLLRTRPDALEQLFLHLDVGVFQVADLPSGCGSWLAAFLNRYRDNRAQVADAALMYLAEVRQLDTVFTLDRRDFSIYRTRQGLAMTLVPAQ